MLRLPFLKRLETVDASPEGQAVEAFVVAMRDEMRDGRWFGGSGLKKTACSQAEVYARIVGVQGAERGAMALALLRRARAIAPQGYGHREDRIRDDLIGLAERLASTKGALPPEDFPEFVELWLASVGSWPSFAGLVGMAEAVAAEHGLTPELAAALRPLPERIESNRGYGGNADHRRQANRVRLLLDPGNAAAINLPEPWQAPFRGAEWAPLLNHAAKAKTNLAEKWAKAMRPLIDAAGAERFLEAFGEAVSAVGRMNVGVDTLHSDTLRGLAWAAGLTGTPRAASSLGRLAVASAHKLPGIGARSPKGFSGAVGALERMGTFESLAELSNARNRIKVANLAAAATAALERAAALQNMPLAELEEIVVPTYGLELPGARTEILSDVEARLEIVGTTEVALRWFRGGKELKSPPSEAKEAAKGLRATKKEIEAALAAQRSRIEGLMSSGRTVPYVQWRACYLDHPLLANMARRLVWRFADAGGERLGIAPEGVPTDAEGRPLEGLESTTVRLWHPLQAGVSAIEAWRDRLVVREIRQPFKQAYREVYLLTAAEERTRTYSNRFAAHVLKQHQMAALARGRGWRYALQGFFDGGESRPTLDLPEWGLRAEYVVEVGDFAGDEGTTESGIARYVLTDQVRFVDSATGASVPLDEVPPLAFSETMRDVDLLVGVSSVGNDPTWTDQGERTGYGGYWRQVSFGDLSATAETRKAVLERLLPRLAVGRVSRIVGKFLVVQGKRRTYKIHLGSGNVLMEPNDQYLCIVPGSAGKGGEKVYLPFEGDGVLAIILSKAALLMDDDQIADPTILRQLRGL